VPIEVLDKEQQLEIIAEVPGFKAEEIAINAGPRRLTLSGTAEKTTERRKGKSLYSERRAESFMRSFDLPVTVDPDRARASLRDGMLTITLVKSDPARARESRIPVERG
jgi:HSP20 family protein